jgi:REP element-mobilizing transposase RayT
MSYWQLFYHLVWATKKRQPLLTAEIEPIIFGHLRTKANDLETVVFALNGVADHVHMVVAIPPKVAVSKFVGQVKGFSSTQYNQRKGQRDPFYWQLEYAAFSFDRKRLPNYVAYVQNQKQHHAQSTTIPILERIEGEGVKMMRETAENYFVEENHWRRELMALTETEANEQYFL